MKNLKLSQFLCSIVYFVLYILCVHRQMTHCALLIFVVNCVKTVTLVWYNLLLKPIQVKCFHTLILSPVRELHVTLNCKYTLITWNVSCCFQCCYCLTAVLKRSVRWVCVKVIQRCVSPMEKATEINLLFQSTVSCDCCCVAPNPETHMKLYMYSSWLKTLEQFPICHGSLYELVHVYPVVGGHFC